MGSKYKKGASVEQHVAEDMRSLGCKKSIVDEEPHHADLPITLILLASSLFPTPSLSL